MSIKEPVEMDEDRLVRILKQEAAAASSYHDSELAKAQEEGLNRYFARPYGNEIKGRCNVVTHDVEDTVNWMMPDLMRTFASAEDLVSVKAKSKDDDNPYVIGMDPQSGQPKYSSRTKADLMAAYLSHVYFEDNDGLQVTHDVAFDGLVQRIGIWRIDWEDPEPQPSDIIEGVSEQQLQRYLSDPEYEILAFDEYQGDNGPLFILEVQRTPKMGRVHVEAVPPEEFAIDKTAKSVKAAKYHRRRRKVYLSEIKKQYPEKADELSQTPGGDEGWQDDGRLQARFPGDNVSWSETDDTEGRQEVDLHEEFIRIDFDGDGIVELRSIKRIGNIILENVRVRSSGFVTWTPSRVSHRAVGRSIPDELKDIAVLRTEITRRYIDGLSQTITPRTFVNTLAFGEDETGQNGLDALLDNELGAVIPVRGDPRAAVYETVTPDVSGPSLNALEYFDQRGQESTGVTKHSQGMDPSQMNKTATGIDLLQAAAKTRIEMIARWLGAGMEDVFKRILELLVEHQDKPRQIKLFGDWCEVDPRTWSDEMAVAINIGAAGVSKQARLANLAMIAQKQEQVLMTAGAGNPLVSLAHLRSTYAAMVGCMGFRDATLFFGEVPEDFAPEPQPDPKMEEVKGKLELEKTKAEQTMALDTAKAQHAAMQEEQKRNSEREKATIELQLAREKAAAEMQLARERMYMEMELARERAALEADQAERDSQRRHDANMEAARAKGINGGNGGSEKLGSNRPGGSLAQ